MEFKNSPLHIKDIDVSQGIVTGYASTFDVIDSGNDVVKPGAFKRTINAWGPNGKKRIKSLFMHEPAWMVGKPLVLYEDHVGLYHETQFSVRNSLAKDVLVLIEDGVITEQSIGYDVIDFEMEGNIRNLKELRLYEYSWVAWGMNEYTPIMGIKSEQQYQSLLKSMARFEKALKNGHFRTDEVPEMMELALKRWREEIRYWEEQLNQRKEPSQKEMIMVKNEPTPFELKVRDFATISADSELRTRGWRLVDALYSTYEEIRYEHGKDDNVPELLAESIEQFKQAMVEWAIEAQKAGLFYASPDAPLDEYTTEEIKAMLPGLFSFAQKLNQKALSGQVDPAEATSSEGNPLIDDDMSDSGDHSLDVKDLVAPLQELKVELQSKALLTELREFGKSLRSDN